jgi:hypothetical protein
MKNKALLLLTFLFLACSTIEKPSTVQPDVARFFEVYQTFLQLNANDSTGMEDKSVLMDSALAMHDMEAAQFDTTLNFLERNPDIFLQAFEMFDDSLKESLDLGVD